MKYTLNKPKDLNEQKISSFAAAKKLWPLLREEKKTLILAIIAIIVNSTLTLIAPLIVAHVIDTYIGTSRYDGVILFSVLLLAIFIIALIASYLQTKLMGGVGQRVLYRLRNSVFNKLQELPVVFFNQNKAGDLISRINNDTDKLNQFFSQALMQFIGSAFIMLGAAVFLVFINVRLGFAALAPVFGLLIFTQLTSAWIKSKNAMNMKALGGMSSEIQESLNNFKVIVAFNRRDYFRERFQQANNENYQSSIGAGLANNLYTPIYGLSSHLAQLIVLSYGVVLIAGGDFTVGLLISFLAYVLHFYNPLRHLASLWTTFQTAMAGWDRVSEILAMEPDLLTIESETMSKKSFFAFENVSFGYPDGKTVLHDINFQLEKGKTYALVGPTGGGKTTTASLMARLYDPTSGTVILDGKDIRSYSPTERTKKIGFILQEPFLFAGTVIENIFYGNEEYAGKTSEELKKVIEASGLAGLLKRFDGILDMKVSATGDAISLGQRQLIAFMRAVLRKPELLILDEATANVDTVTEKLLEETLEALPKETTKVVIAHRLNTIENADEIFFVNGGTVRPAGSMEQAVEMLMQGKRKS